MCGITGFYPKKKQSADFNVLKGIAAINDERGKDNSGISIGDVFYERCDTNKYIRDLIVKFKKDIAGLDLVEKPWIMHTRSASAKTKQKATHAHPFYWEYVNEVGEKIDYFYGCHNGFVSNTVDIHKKYLLDTNMRKNYASAYDVDSEILLDAIYCNLYDEEIVKNILRDYTGNAALVFYTANSFFVWKGASNNVEERPLYFVETKAGWYFSSIEASLSMYFDNVKAVPNNTLMVFEDNKFVKSVEIPRVFTVKTYHGNNYNHVNHAHMLPEGGKAREAVSTWLFLSGTTGIWTTTVKSDKDSIINGGLTGDYWIDNPIKDSFIFDSYSKKNDTPIFFYHGVPSKKKGLDVSSLIAMLQIAQTQEAITNMVAKFHDEISDFMVGFVPYRINGVLAGFIIKINNQVMILEEGFHYTVCTLGRVVKLIHRAGGRVYMDISHKLAENLELQN